MPHSAQRAHGRRCWGRSRASNYWAPWPAAVAARAVTTGQRNYHLLQSQCGQGCAPDVGHEIGFQLAAHDARGRVAVATELVREAAHIAHTWARSRGRAAGPGGASAPSGVAGIVLTAQRAAWHAWVWCSPLRRSRAAGRAPGQTHRPCPRRWIYAAVAAQNAADRASAARSGRAGGRGQPPRALHGSSWHTADYFVRSTFVGGAYMQVELFAFVRVVDGRLLLAFGRALALGGGQALHDRLEVEGLEYRRALGKTVAGPATPSVGPEHESIEHAESSSRCGVPFCQHGDKGCAAPPDAHRGVQVERYKNHRRRVSRPMASIRPAG